MMRSVVDRFTVHRAAVTAALPLALAACGSVVAPEKQPTQPTAMSGPARGCGLGTSCTAGNDLPAPPIADGFQVVTPPGVFTVEPGQEAFQNYCVTLPNTSEFDVGAVQSWMTAESSHELIVYHQPATAGSGGVGAGCVFGGELTWMYAASIAGQVVELKMPDGVGVPLSAGTEIILNMHFANVSSVSEQPQVKVNLLRAQNFHSAAGTMVSFNQSIDIPGATAAGAGTQTVNGICTAPAGSQFFLLGTQTNRLATTADVNFVSGGRSTNVVHTTDWESPDVHVWTAPQFLAVGPGDSFAYSCSYSNRGPAAVTVGEAMSNEKCMAVGYYFPAGMTSCQ
jgi:hypothetical protein